MDREREDVFRAPHWVIAAVLLVLAIATSAGLVRTRNTPVQLLPSKEDKSKANLPMASEPAVDQKPLQTARALAAMATTPDEQNYAHQALKTADFEVDLAFADAMRQAAAHPPQATPELRALSARVTQVENVVKAGQDRVNQLTRQIAAANEKDKDALEDQLDVVKAQLELDQDELDDAKEDLLRAGGNPQGRIQRLMEEHEAGNHATAPAMAPSTTATAESLWPQIQAWIALHRKRLALYNAHVDALNAVQALSRAHDAFEKQLQEQEEQKQAVKQKAAGISTGAVTPGAADTKQAAKEAVTSLHRFSEDQKILADFDKRVQSQQELADVYQNWGALAKAQEQAALHGVLQAFLWILLIAALVYGTGLLLDRYFADLTPDKTRLITLRAVVWFAIQAVGLLLAALVVFGMPSQMPTILGLAGAGLTVALKDFIVGFVGWFVLMGRNGIRVGDWVEINGVGGEVVEIGLLRTTLLETGNWTDSGHPTGRRVSFVNSYAIEGHYFNFSTSGQWLWDEISLSLPTNQNPYPIIEQVQKLVVEQTAENSHQAEMEWQRAAARYRVHSFSAAPAINLRPTGSGIELHVRYITRAYERQTTRARLYAAIVELMHRKETPAASSAGRA